MHAHRVPGRDDGIRPLSLLLAVCIVAAATSVATLALLLTVFSTGT